MIWIHFDMFGVCDVCFPWLWLLLCICFLVLFSMSWALCSNEPWLSLNPWIEKKKQKKNKQIKQITCDFPHQCSYWWAEGSWRWLTSAAAGCKLCPWWQRGQTEPLSLQWPWTVWATQTGPRPSVLHLGTAGQSTGDPATELVDRDEGHVSKQKQTEDGDSSQEEDELMFFWGNWIDTKIHRNRRAYILREKYKWTYSTTQGRWQNKRRPNCWEQSVFVSLTLKTSTAMKENGWATLEGELQWWWKVWGWATGEKER